MTTVPLPLNSKLFQNVEETSLKRAAAAIENATITDAEGIRRVPGLRRFATLADMGRVYLTDWRDDLMAATSFGRLYRVDSNGNAQDVTGVPLSGGRRVVFAKTEDHILLAAGGPILHFDGTRTEILSADAPLSTHVAYIDGYTIAIEPRSGRFFHTAPGDSFSWDALDVFTAEGKPDDLNAMLVTQFRELLLAGEDSIEQFERTTLGDRPFFRRWATGEGVAMPYTLVEADQGVWAVNKKREFVRFSGQQSRPSSDDIGAVLMSITDWTDAWAAPLLVNGQKFILLQAPKAKTPYDTEGLTFLFDYRAKRWHTLYGRDSRLALPTRWPGWSVHQFGERVFIGGEGVIYEMTKSSHDLDGEIMRTLYRSAHYRAPLLLGGRPQAVEIGDIRIDLKRGVAGSNDPEPTLSLRVKKNNGPWTKTVRRSLGRAGDRDMVLSFGAFGHAQSFQLEIEASDAAELELVQISADLEPVDA